METTLKIRRIGNYSMIQAKPNEHCYVCENEEMGDVLIEGICGKCLIKNYHKKILTEIIVPELKKNNHDINGERKNER